MTTHTTRTREKRLWLLSGIAGMTLALLAGACSQTAPTRTPAPATPATRPAAAPPLTRPTVTDTTPANFPGLHNVVAYGRDVLSGSVPEGAEGFQSLQRMGVRSIVSVDGAEPDLAAARSAGLRYVHLPVTYAGFSEQRKLEIARALRDLPRPIYVHCHHGKHRSAGAAGAAAVTLGELSAEQAVARMKVSGTAPEYKGLYACTAGASRVLPAVLDAVTTDLPEVTRPQGTVKSMVEIDVAMENLKACQSAGWKAPAQQPDLSPAAEAGRMADLLRFLENDEHTRKQPADYARLLLQSNQQVEALETLLTSQPLSPVALDAQWKRVQQSCKACHAVYRD
jgi:protein tyrosine phosphatase (PTP) superfamily phosphohydrolase (DUF442 family)